jgi:hypothetical protein
MRFVKTSDAPVRAMCEARALHREVVASAKGEQMTARFNPADWVTVLPRQPRGI